MHEQNTHLNLHNFPLVQVTGKADEVHGKAKATVGQASDSAQAAKDHATGKAYDAYNTVSVLHNLAQCAQIWCSNAEWVWQHSLMFIGLPKLQLW